MLLTKQQIERRIRDHAVNGVVQDISHTFYTKDKNPSEEVKQEVWKYAYGLFPSGGYEAIAAFHNWIENYMKSDSEIHDIASYVERTYNLNDKDKLALALHLIQDSNQDVEPDVVVHLRDAIA